jgi:hypothetical protein
MRPIAGLVAIFCIFFAAAVDQPIQLFDSSGNLPQPISSVRNKE